MNHENAPESLEDEFETVWTEVPVFIPTLDGKDVAETIPHRVQALKSRKTGEIYLDGNALAELDRVKARHLGLLTPQQIKELREHMGLTQEAISKLLQIGEKSWTRWETGRERPSRSMNLFLHTLWDGKVTIPYLQLMGNPALRQEPIEPVRTGPARETFSFKSGSQATEETLVNG
jgi:DNA-binding transcriptional regulator YiaG